MTKKKKVSPLRKYRTISFKIEDTVIKTPSKSVPTNLAEEKEKFLNFGKLPRFQVDDPSKLNELASKTKNRIRFDLQGEAEWILEKVREQYGDGELYLEHAFGPKITKEEANPSLLQYLEENALTESLDIHWCENMACSAKMVWRGPVVNANKPELRKYSLWINSSDENNYMRESGIKCLMDHEIGTHFFRMFNDGLQPWFSDRARFDLRCLGALEGQRTEEGLASINTVLRGRVKLLWGSALAYYSACKSAEMSFKQLFDHIGRYTSNREYRWKQVMRIKRGLLDPNDLGGFGNDQCYFEGAVSILRNLDNIDFHLLMSGKVCHDELDRIKRVVRRDVVKYPVFMKNMAAYQKSLKKMIALNGLDVMHPARIPPAVYIKRMNERREATCGRKKKKVRSSSVMVVTKRAKNHAKGISFKKEKIGTKKSEIEEVQSFPVSERFINIHLQPKQGSMWKDNKLYQDVISRSSQLSNTDVSLEKQIQHLQKIVREHSWSSQDDAYKSKILNETSVKAYSDIGGNTTSQNHLVEESGLCENSPNLSQNQTRINNRGMTLDALPRVNCLQKQTVGNDSVKQISSLGKIRTCLIFKETHQDLDFFIRQQHPLQDHQHGWRVSSGCDRLLMYPSTIELTNCDRQCIYPSTVELKHCTRQRTYPSSVGLTIASCQSPTSVLHQKVERNKDLKIDLKPNELFTKAADKRIEH